ncbi:MAG: hypothetical protein CVV27_01080 [Candidatus Melainabacteria bacterium HGW-Melainabacteria-1]|nr:MAG: hypothetical protein CVV27_01080 [Candidatus Melainabacteria bacterium HGW-Melainabacteria-1]
MSAHVEHASHGAHEHPDHVPVYIKLAVVLSVLTGIEVAILFVALPDALMLTGLYGLAALKFGLVVAMFMHLKYDNKILTGIFFSGFTIALATMFAMVALINYQPTKTSIHVKTSKELAALNAGDASKGPEVFMAKGCAACHAISSLPGAVGAVGPKLDGLSQRAAALGGKDYIKQSIDNPNAVVVEGYPAGLMPANLKASMSDDEYKNLISYLETL